MQAQFKRLLRDWMPPALVKALRPTPAFTVTAANLLRLGIDNTLQPKVVTFPTDAKLLNRARERGQ